MALTDGVDTISSSSDATRTALFDRSDTVIDIVNIAATTAHARFDAFGSRDEDMGFDRFQRTLRDVTDRTGGRLFNVTPTDDFVPAVREAIDAARLRYVLHFTPTSAQPGWHALSVAVPGKKYEIHARRGYWRE